MYAPTAAPTAYQQSAVLTAPPERLVLMLYDGARRFLLQAAAAMREDQIGRSHEKLTRAELILEELQSTLDMEAGEMAERLEAIYVFCRRHLMEARIERNPGKVEKVVELLGELREAWAQVAGA